MLGGTQIVQILFLSFELLEEYVKSWRDKPYISTAITNNSSDSIFDDLADQFMV